jgi:hypothetical protein
MHFSRRSKVVISVFGTLALVGALAAVIVPLGLLTHAAQAAPHTVTTTVGGKPVTLKLIGQTSKWGSAFAKSAAATQGKDRTIPQRTPGGHTAFSPGTHASAAVRNGAPHVTSSPLTPEGGLRSNFDGLTDTQNKAIAGFHDTPPDQGLCVGFLDGFGGKVVIEVVNSIIGIYTTGGTLLSAFPLTAGFFDVNAFSDPRCFYDASTSSFYMTVISCFFCGPPGTADSVNDVLVVNRSGMATDYQYDTSEGGTCFGDQPHTGYDANAVYVATDQFCGTDGNTYLGALLIAISKPQLAAQGALPNAVSFVNLSLGGIPILTLEPAVGSQYGTEYLVNAFPFDQFGNSNPISNTLGLWEVHEDHNITSGSGTVTLIGRIIGSETYAFPVPAASTGDGTTPSGSPSFVIKEPFLNPDDDRMLQVQLANTPQGLRLYCALDTALTIGSDPSDRDGVAWFVINPKTHTESSQGYIGMAGAYLLYPAIEHSNTNTTAIAFTITSPSINPSAAYVFKKDTGLSFSSVLTVATGSGPHVSFSDLLFGRARWGDYSAEELDPNGRDIWSATEYIPPTDAGGSDLIDNWGTRIWDVAGSSH